LHDAVACFDGPVGTLGTMHGMSRLRATQGRLSTALKFG
jgi:hypothetical protein